MDIIEVTPFVRKKDEFITFVIKHPLTGKQLKDEEGNPVVFIGYTKYSDQYRKALSRVNKPSYKHLARCTAEFLAETSICVTNIVYEGKPLDNYKTFVEVYMDPGLAWFTEQVCAALLGGH